MHTGEQVAPTRVPVQLVTFLAPVRNMLVIGESPDTKIGHLPVHDVFSHLYDEDEPVLPGDAGKREMSARRGRAKGKPENGGSSGTRFHSILITPCHLFSFHNTLFISFLLF